MNWQENVVLQRSKGPEKSSGEPQGDSKILRYIKTLTNHQKKAKQQRMDQYMQQVKHPRPVERDIKSWKSSQDLSTTGRLHPHETQSKESSMQFVKNPPKRSYEEKQSYRQQKKPKRAPSKQQADVVGSLDRFRLNGTWAQDKRQTRENECSGTLHSSTGSKTTQQLQTQTSTYQAQTRTVNPVLDKFTSGLNQRGIEKLPVEVLKHPPTNAFSAHAPSTSVQDPRYNSIQHDFLSQEDEQQDLDCGFEQEAFVAAYDPLSATMELIYF